MMSVVDTTTMMITRSMQTMSIMNGTFPDFFLIMASIIMLIFDLFDSEVSTLSPSVLPFIFRMDSSRTLLPLAITCKK